MATNVPLPGKIITGYGDASNWGVEDIRRVTERPDLHRGTINVKLGVKHELRRDYALPREDRADERDEELYFERCFLVTRNVDVPALIARTSRNAHGSDVLEIMAAWVPDLHEDDAVVVEVCED